MEYKCKEGMIDNRMVKGDHQEGIKRVLQRKEDRNDVEGHKGSMAKGWSKSAGSESNWKRSGKLTPRQA